ncbi:MAG TPA: hypothetical protein EYQ20_08830 [candidate division Zixibacteria bacterium]|jgi:hypothetical protein|nr:hypothetical protein [Candidatus Latescibacterota bacterium]MDP7239101.1 hypothetical protein [Candidatus Latescibacterota bacterium]HIG46505.1 hypothetical protein [candidate division Zixibacteria bacterium]
MAKWVRILLGTIMLTPLVSMAQDPSPLGITAGDREVKLFWQPTDIENVSHYELYRSVYNGYLRLDSEVTTFTDTGLDNGVTYYYALVAVDSDGNKWEIARGTPATPVDLPPSPPDGFKASGRDEEVRLRWSTLKSKDTVGYLLLRSLNEMPFTESTRPIITLDKMDSMYVDQRLVNGTVYTYNLISVDETGNRSEPASDIGVPLPVPEELTIRPADKTVHLAWSSNKQPNLSHYVLYRTNSVRESPEIQDFLARVDINDSTYTDTGLTNGLIYYYYLTLVDPHGYSNVNVEPVSAVPENLPPLAPSGLRVATAMRDATIEWIRNPEPDVIRYHLYRSMGSTGDMENGVPIAQADANDTTYTDPGLDAGTAYFYYLTAEDDSGQLSNRSKQVSISIRGKPHGDRSLIYFIFPAGYALLLFLGMPL